MKGLKNKAGVFLRRKIPPADCRVSSCPRAASRPGGPSQPHSHVSQFLEINLLICISFCFRFPGRIRANTRCQGRPGWGSSRCPCSLAPFSYSHADRRQLSLPNFSSSREVLTWFFFFSWSVSRRPALLGSVASPRFLRSRPSCPHSLPSHRSAAAAEAACP